MCMLCKLHCHVMVHRHRSYRDMSAQFMCGWETADVNDHVGLETPKNGISHVGSVHWMKCVTKLIPPLPPCVSTALSKHGDRAAVRSVVAARGGHGTVNHEQLLHGQLYREGMGGGANCGFLNGGYSNSYLTTSMA